MPIHRPKKESKEHSFLHQPRARSQFGRTGLSRRKLEAAITYMRVHASGKSTLDDLAREVGISRSHFCRLFRISTGDSPMGYWLRLKVELAKLLLQRQEHLIGDIAHLLGFFDQSHFSRTFKRITGLSPREYVRQYDMAEIARVRELWEAVSIIGAGPGGPFLSRLLKLGAPQGKSLKHRPRRAS